MEVADKQPGFAKSVLVGICFTALFVLVSGYQFGGSGGVSWEVPLIQKVINPELYPGDFLFSFPYRVSFFWQGMGLLGKLSGLRLQYLYVICYLVCIFFTWFWLYRLARLVCRDERAVFVALALLLYLKHLPADTSLVDSSLRTKAAALPFLLFGFYQLLRSRPLSGFIGFGLGFLLHPLSASHAVVMAGMYALIFWRGLSPRKLALGVAAFVVLALPLLLWNLSESSLGGRFPFVAGGAYLNMLKLRDSPYLFPFTWGCERFFNVGVLVLLYGYSVKRMGTRRIDRKVLALWIGIGLLAIAGTIFAELLPLSLVLYFQPWRAARYILLFGAFYAGNILSLLFAGRLSQRVVAAGLLAGIFFGDVPLTLLSLSGLALIELPRPGAFSRLLRWGLLLAAGAVILVATLRPQYGLPPAFALKWTRLLGALACAALAAFYPRFARRTGWTLLRDKLTWVTPLVLVVVLVAGRLVMGTGLPVSFLGLPRNGDWLGVAEWARSNTTVDERFLIPPYLEGFRAYSERGVVVTGKDGSFAVARRNFGVDWAHRMQTVCGFGLGQEDWARQPLELMRQGYNAHKEQGFLELANRYQADYIIIEKPKQLRLPVAYQNQSFAVYHAEGHLEAD